MRRGCGRNGLLPNSNCIPDSLGLPVAHMKLSDMLDTFNQSRHRVEVNLVWRMPLKARMRPLRIVEVQIPADQGARVFDALIGPQINLFIFDAAPEPFRRAVKLGSLSLQREGTAGVDR